MNKDLMNFIMNMMRSGGSPDQIAMQWLQQQNNPMTNNLLSMIQKGDSAGVEQVARNLCKQKGIDFDKEFKAFKEQLGFR